MTHQRLSTHDIHGEAAEPDASTPHPDERRTGRRRKPRPYAGHQHHGRTRRTAIAAALLFAAVGVVVDAQPAAASAPQCNSSATWRMHDANGDPYGGTSAFDYTITTPAYRNSSGSYSTNCWLAKGSIGGEVLTLQKTINHCYGPYWLTQHGAVVLGLQVTEDGIYGSQTAAALAKIQSYHHIAADGVYGLITATHIRHRGTETAGDLPGPLCHTLGG